MMVRVDLMERTAPGESVVPEIRTTIRSTTHGVRPPMSDPATRMSQICSDTTGRPTMKATNNVRATSAERRMPSTGGAEVCA